MAPTPTRLMGDLLARGTSLIDHLRETRKPLHPYGATWAARLTRTGAQEHPTGAAFLDTAGEDDVVVRLSEGVGLPRSWPDVLGLAIRVPEPDGPADVLLSTTGAGRLTRFLAAPTRRPTGSTFSTLMPYRSSRGPVLIAATAQSATDYELSHALGTGPWRRFGHLELRERVAAEPSFDPIGNLPRGLEHYAWARRLRAPAYRTARAGRGEE